MLTRSKFILLFAFFSIFQQYSFGQASLSDSSINISIVGVSYSLLIPQKDFKERFGVTSGLGLSYSYKNKSNWLFSCDYNLLLSMDVKENDLFKNISTSDGYLINNIGLMQPIGKELRGHHFDFAVGKIFPIIGPNQNSGLFFKFGGGFLQHKILLNYESAAVSVPQIENEYAKGYDRLTYGFSISQKLGYYYFSNSNLGSFHIDLFLIEGFTQNRRSWNFDLMSSDNAKRLDLLVGINLGLDIPIYKRVPDEFYIY